jgi:hypothetical protein
MTILPLEADGPAPEHADELMLFGRFVGSWDLEGTLFDPDGEPRKWPGEWHFAWALGGRAIQDVLIVPGFEYGTTIRFYDPEAGNWQITWITPPQRAVRRLVARPDGDDILLEGEDPVEGRMRWSFSEIADDSFLWQGRYSHDGGETWFLKEEMRLSRRPS